MVEGSTWTKPVHDGYFADPFVMRHGRRFYAYGTNNVDDAPIAFEVLCSDDLVHWTSLGRALEPVDGLSPKDHWAPEVAERGGRFFMYFSAGVDDTEHRLRVAVADRPEGPFNYGGALLTPDDPFVFHASPFRDDDDEFYWFYGHVVLDVHMPGTSIALFLLFDMTR